MPYSFSLSVGSQSKRHTSVLCIFNSPFSKLPFLTSLPLQCNSFTIKSD